MKSLVTLGLVLVAFAFTSVQAEDACLKVGDRVGAFNVKDVTGPSAGKSLCYRCQYGARPVVTVFARNVNEDLAKLVTEVDKIVEANKDKKMAAFVVVLAEDADKVAPKLEEIAKKNNVKNVPLTIFDGEAGPDGYKISEKSETTVMMWNKSSIVSNTSLGKGELNAAQIKKIVEGTGELTK